MIIVRFNISPWSIFFLYHYTGKGSSDYIHLVFTLSLLLFAAVDLVSPFFHAFLLWVVLGSRYRLTFPWCLLFTI